MLTAFEPYMDIRCDSGFLIPRLPIDFKRTVPLSTAAVINKIIPMELRRAEAELSAIRSAYESIRARPIRDVPSATYVALPLLFDLIRNVRSERLPEREAAASAAGDAAAEAEAEAAAAAAAAAEIESEAAAVGDIGDGGAEAAGAGMNPGASDTERGPPSEASRRAEAAAAASKAAAAISASAAAAAFAGSGGLGEEGEGSGAKENAGASAVGAGEALSALESLRARTEALGPAVAKVRKRLRDTDAVTGFPRYGSKTAGRATTLLDAYDAVRRGVDLAFLCDDGSGATTTLTLVDALQEAVRRDEKSAANAAAEAEASAARAEGSARAAAQREEEGRAAAEREAARRAEEERAALYQAAFDARIRREEEEERVEREAREADRAFVRSVPKGPEGVRAQIIAIREGCQLEEGRKAAGTFDKAIGALHTIFSQILSHPDEVKFRRIRRDHPQFLQDIGRHPGGKEVLVAAGFKLETVDGVPCFFSREPDVERDMDGWSSWFDGLKQTLEVIEEQMMK